MKKLFLILLVAVAPFAQAQQSDLHTTLDYVAAINPDRITANTAELSAVFDMSKYLGIEFVIQTGTLADVNATFAVLVQHGDTVDSATAPTEITDATDAPDASLYGTEAAASFTYANDNVVKVIGYKRTKRWVQLKITPSGNSGNADLSAVAVLRPLAAPVR